MSVQSDQFALGLRCVITGLLVFLYGVRANTLLNRTNTYKVNTNEVNSIVLHCPVIAPSDHGDEAHLVVQWITPKFLSVSQTSIDQESGVFKGDNRLRLTPNGSLAISPLCFPDFGYYQCLVHRVSINGTRLFISDATVSLKFHVDVAEEFKADNCNVTSFADPSNSYIITLSIVLFICGAIFGIIAVFCVNRTVRRCRVMYYRKTVARLRKGSVHELSVRGGSVKNSTVRGGSTKKDSTHTNVATEDPKEAFVMYVNPLQDEPSFHGYMADPFPPSPPPRLQHQDSSLTVSQEFGLTPGLSFAIHAGSLQELHTTGSDDATRARPLTWNPKIHSKNNIHPMGIKKGREQVDRCKSNAKNDIGKNHVSTSSSVKTPSSSGDYEMISQVFKSPSLVVESEVIHEGSNDTYLRPSKAHRSLEVFPLPPPPLTSSECLGADSCSHTSFPLPPPPSGTHAIDPQNMNTDSKGALQNTNTWPKRVSSRRRYQSISGMEPPDYMEIIASADCIHLSNIN